MTQKPAATTPANDSPLTNFSKCHEGIVAHLQTFNTLPGLLDSAARARQVAEETLQFFRQAVFDHHAEEEKDLFPSVLASAANGDERKKVLRMVDGLTTEHRDIEALWARLEGPLEKAARGQRAELDASLVDLLVRKYTGHARLEEAEFLPLAEKILGRDSPQSAALGLSLHMRHVVRAAHRGLRGS